MNGCSFSENFDGVTVPNLPTGWTQQVITGARRSTTGRPSTRPAARRPTRPTNDPAAVSDKVLVTPPIVMAMVPSQLSFRNNFNTEASTTDPTLGFDGGVLEIKIGAGSFQDIITAGGSFVVGGYTRTISTGFSSPIAVGWRGAATRPASSRRHHFPGRGAGQTIQLRWRVANDVRRGTGQFIDTITLSGVLCPNSATARRCLQRRERLHRRHVQPDGQDVRVHAGQQQQLRR
jgi:hypothetical protein